jgi:rubrerythrin
VSDPADIERMRANLRDELNAAALYSALAAAEPDSRRSDLFLQLAAAESRHAQLWRDKLAAAGVKYISDGVNHSDRIGSALVAWQDKPFWWIPASGRATER